jgi:hypothetical protein
VDEFLAKAKMGRCSSFREAAEVVGRQAFPMFLNVTANVTNWNADGTECSLVHPGGGEVNQGPQCCEGQQAAAVALAAEHALPAGATAYQSARPAPKSLSSA